MAWTGFGGGWSGGSHYGGDSSGSIGGSSASVSANGTVTINGMSVKPGTPAAEAAARGDIAGALRAGGAIAIDGSSKSSGNTTQTGNGGNSGNGNGTSSSSSSAKAAAAQAQAAAAAEAARQAEAAEAARQAEAARIAEQQRQQRIAAENVQRASLQQQIASTDSADATRNLMSQINSLGTEADNAAALNKSLLDSANQRLGLQVQTQSNNAIGAAQAAKSASTTTTGTNTAAYSGKISQAVGTPISQADQAANTAEAKRMGGYNLTSTAGRIGNVAKAALGGLAIGGPVGGLLGTAASVYSNFISDRQSASSRTLTEGTAAPKTGISDVLAGMTTGAIKGALLGPLGMMAGAVWGGATASGTAPTAADLKGSSPLTNGQTSNPTSAGPGQTLVNGVRVGQGGNGNDYKPGGLAPVFGGGTYTPPDITTPATGNNTSTTPSNGGSSFGSFLDDLRRRQMNNLLYTGAGWNQTSGTSLLGRVGAAQGAVGGLSGQIISQYGGGRSLLGGAWSW